jgi:hypothetical protein
LAGFWQSVASPFESVGSFLAKHWQTIAVAALSTAVFVGVTALTGGLGAPIAAELLAGGVASGVAGYLLSNYLKHAPITLEGALFAGALSGAVTLATAGLGRLVEPYIPTISVPALDGLLSTRTGSMAFDSAVNATVGTALGAGEQVAVNAAERHPLGDGVGNAALQGGLSGAFMVPAERLGGQPVRVSLANARGQAPAVAPPPDGPPSVADAPPSVGEGGVPGGEPSRTTGIAGALEGGE